VSRATRRGVLPHSKDADLDLDASIADPPLILQEALPALKNPPSSTVALPDDAEAVEERL
jgi:hypothetical protein